MRKKIYFDSHYGLETYALCEDGKLIDYCSEPVASGAVIGNIYKGKITDVLSGMQAAFVDCGLERHCYLSFAEAGEQTHGEGVTALPSVPELHAGDEILVQVTKAAQGKKGAKVTCHPSFVGKYIVYTPTIPFVGVSAKITDEELRKNLIYSAKKQVSGTEGLVMRTAAPYAVKKDKLSEFEHFRKLYANILKRFNEAPVGELLYSDSPLYMRVLRDLPIDNGDEIHVGNHRLYESVKQLIATHGEHDRATVTEHDEHTDMFYSEGIFEQFLQTLQPKVELENGAYLIIERTEALTVIDVNTGKFTGEDSLEHTVYCTNVLATREIARQVKLRNMGGIFVVDFIDMDEENHKQAIVEELEKALRADKSKCRVLPMSKFGLVEFTRKRTGVATSDAVTEPCRLCNGTGSMRTVDSILSEFRARLLEVLSEGAATVCADLNITVANRLLGYAELKADIAALYPEARIYVVSHRTYQPTNIYLRKVNSPHFSLPEGAVLLY